MKPRDASGATVAVGLLTLWMAFTDAMLDYVKASMRPWLVAAGVALVVIGLAGLVRISRAVAVRSAGGGAADEHGHGHSRVGWLLVLPIAVVIVVGTQSLGSFAAGRAGSRALPEYSFDISGYAREQGKAVPSLQVLDVYLGADQSGNRQYLLTHDIRLRGFVTGDPLPGGAGGGFVLNRFLISCCAADATRLSVAMTGAATVPADDTWVEVRARLVPRRPAGTEGAAPRSVFRVRSVRHVPAPSDPYEGLR